MNVAATLATLRVARRDVRRSKGRSALITLMICIPLALVCMVDVVLTTQAESPTEAVERQMGAGGARLQKFSDQPLTQDPKGNNSGPHGEVDALDVVSVLPPGTKSTTDAKTFRSLRTRNGIGTTEVRLLDIGNPLTTGMFKIVDGRAPATSSEVAITKSTVKRSGATIGQRIEVDGRPFTVSAIVEQPNALKNSVVVSLPGTFDVSAEDKSAALIVDAPFPWSKVQAANRQGVVVISRLALLDPPSANDIAYSTGDDSATADVLPVLMGSIAVFEICLLAGAAFSVGARRSRRTFALIAVTGGTARDLRRIVLGGAALIGIGATSIGVLVGIGAAAATQSWAEGLAGYRFGALNVRPAHLAVIAGCGVFTAMLAALLPSVAASRLNVIEALTGRNDPLRSRQRLALTAASSAVTALGVALVIFGSGTRDTSLITVGSIVAQIGLVLSVPALLRIVGRMSPKLPFGVRLGLRDVVRNSSRSAPTIAATMAGVALAVSIGISVSAVQENERSSYVPQSRIGNVVPNQIGSQQVPISIVESVLRSTMPIDLFGTRFPAYVESTSCSNGQNGDCSRSVALEQCNGCGGPIVGDENALRAIFGKGGQAAFEAVRGGKIVVSDPSLVREGRITLKIEETSSDGQAQVVRRETLEALVVPIIDKQAAEIYISAGTAERLGLASTKFPLPVASTTRMPTAAEEEKARSLLEASGWDVKVERGYRYPHCDVVLALIALGAAIALISTGIASGLALVDGERDQATLASVGAPPRMRKRTAALQAGVLAVLGVGFGVISGAVPGAAFVWVEGYVLAGDGQFTRRQVQWFDVVPWTGLGLLVLAVPVVSIVGAWIFTRSEVRMTRRAS